MSCAKKASMILHVSPIRLYILVSDRHGNKERPDSIFLLSGP